MKFSIKDFFNKCDQIRWKLNEKLNEDILNEKVFCVKQIKGKCHKF